MFSGWAPLVVLAAIAGAAACGGNGTQFACAADSPQADGSGCNQCVESSCGSVASAAYGSGWQSSNFSGGACASYIECASGCACSATSCFENCAAMMTPECAAALENVSECLDASNCNSACTSVTVSQPTVDGG
jgi:hypothetical protein